MALLWQLDGCQSQGGERARSITRHIEVEAGEGWPELTPYLGALNDPEALHGYRIVVFSDGAIEGVAAAIRHELEHAIQVDVHGPRLVGLHDVAVAVIGERVGELPGGARLYQAIPDEMDADAAAARFVLTRYGPERINALLVAQHPALHPSSADADRPQPTAISSSTQISGKRFMPIL